MLLGCKVSAEIAGFLSEYDLLLDMTELPCLATLKGDLKKVGQLNAAALALAMEGMIVRALQNPVVKKQQLLLVHIHKRIQNDQIPGELLFPMLLAAADSAAQAAASKS